MLFAGTELVLFFKSTTWRDGADVYALFKEVTLFRVSELEVYLPQRRGADRIGALPVAESGVPEEFGTQVGRWRTVFAPSETR